jgi:hypothetical protein
MSQSLLTALERRSSDAICHRRHEDIPLIDIGAFCTGDAAERRSVAEAFDRAFSTTGLCHLCNFAGCLSEAAVEDLRSASTAFFAAEPDTKARSRVDGVVGYLGLGDENVGASTGMPTALPDPVESINLPGYQEEGATWRAAAAADDCPWCDAPWLPATPPAFRDAAVRYWDGATRLMSVLMELSEAALALPSGYFDAAFATPGCLLRVAWYPPSQHDESHPPAPSADEPPQLRCAASRDRTSLACRPSLVCTLLGLPPRRALTDLRSRRTCHRRGAHGLRRIHHPAAQPGEGGRPRVPDARWQLAAGRLAARHVRRKGTPTPVFAAASQGSYVVSRLPQAHSQHWRLARPMDQRPMACDHPPCRGGRRRRGAALDRFLHWSPPGHARAVRALCQMLAGDARVRAHHRKRARHGENGSGDGGSKGRD